MGVQCYPVGSADSDLEKVAEGPRPQGRPWKFPDGDAGGYSEIEPCQWPASFRKFHLVLCWPNLFLAPASPKEMEAPVHTATQEIRDDEGGLDLVWGAEAIARELSVTTRQAHHMLAKGAIPGAKKIGARWCVSRHALREFFLGAVA